VATNVSSTALTTDRGPANQAMVAVMIPGRGTTIDRVVIREVKNPYIRIPAVHSFP